MRARKGRTGPILFTAYLLLYGAFVMVNAFSPQTMELTLFAGVNLAILSGLGLILIAFVFAMIHGVTSRAGGESEGRP